MWGYLAIWFFGFGFFLNIWIQFSIFRLELGCSQVLIWISVSDRYFKTKPLGFLTNMVQETFEQEDLQPVLQSYKITTNLSAGCLRRGVVRRSTKVANTCICSCCIPSMIASTSSWTLNTHRHNQTKEKRFVRTGIRQLVLWLSWLHSKCHIDWDQ